MREIRVRPVVVHGGEVLSTVPREVIAGGIFVEVDQPHHTGINGASDDGIRTAGDCSVMEYNESDGVCLWEVITFERDTFDVMWLPRGQPRISGIARDRKTCHLLIVASHRHTSASLTEYVL